LTIQTAKVLKNENGTEFIFTSKLKLPMMRTTVFAILALLFLAPTTQAQDCQTFFPMQEGTTMEHTYYNKKDKVQSSQLLTIAGVESKADGAVEAKVQYTVQDKKGEETMTGDYAVTCKDDTYMVDASSMLPQQMLESMGEMEVTIDGSQIMLPPDLAVGQELPDANTDIKAGTGGMTIMNMNVKIENRKVEGKETLTTPAGTFDCYKISYEISSKVAFVNKQFSVMDWYAKGVGMVRSETYDKKGKLESYALLTKMEK